MSGRNQPLAPVVIGKLLSDTASTVRIVSYLLGLANAKLKPLIEVGEPTRNLAGGLSVILSVGAGLIGWWIARSGNRRVVLLTILSVLIAAASFAIYSFLRETYVVPYPELSDFLFRLSLAVLYGLIFASLAFLLSYFLTLAEPERRPDL